MSDMDLIDQMTALMLKEEENDILIEKNIPDINVEIMKKKKKNKNDNSSINLLLAQEALDNIHILAKQIHNYMNTTENISLIKRRLAIGALGDIEKITDKLFSCDGLKAHQVIKDLSGVKLIISKLNCSETNIIYIDNNNNKSNESIESIQTNLNKIWKLKDNTNTNLDDDLIPIPSSLLLLLENTRQLEKTFSFQHRLWIEKRLLSDLLNCTVDQFTYGSSGFDLWVELNSHHSWINAIKNDNIPNNIKPIINIFGSSQGLLAFFTAAMNPYCHCIGYEVIPMLHNLSIDTQKIINNHYNDKYNNIKYNNIFNNNIEFFLQDMFQADLSNVKIVVLTSLCWDVETRRKIAKKLSLELKQNGSIVIDYRSNTFSQHGLDKESIFYDSIDIKDNKDILKENDNDYAKKYGRKFDICGIICGSVSWNKNQKLYIYS
jgi:hypothetical protein